MRGRGPAFARGFGEASEKETGLAHAGWPCVLSQNTKIPKFFQKAIAPRNTAAIFTAPFGPKGTPGQHNPQSRELTTLRVQD
jgi:hypothetical protein